MPQVRNAFFAMMDDESQISHEWDVDSGTSGNFVEGETGFALLPMSERWIRKQRKIRDNELVSKQVENVVKFTVVEIEHGDIFISYNDGDGRRLLPLTAEELSEKICDD